MKWSIKRKLVVAFLVTNTLLLAAMAISIHVSFRQGFLDYVNQLENQRVAALQDILANLYGRNGNWSALRQNHDAWRDSIREATPREHSHHHPSSPDQMRIYPRLTLIDADHQIIAGNEHPPGNAEPFPIQWQGQVVGQLLVRPLQLLTDQPDLEFQARQTHALLVALAITALVSLLVAGVLAQHFLAPIRRLTRGTRALTSGRYDARINADSGDELGELAQDFNSLAATLERNDALRRQWMADISHELRTPLAVLSGEIEALQDGVRPLNAKALTSLHQEAAQLSKLINDLYELSLTDLGALSYRKEPLDLPALLEMTLDSLRERFQQQGIDLQVQQPDSAQPLMVFGDATRLTQLFHNLLQNSLRYTDTPGSLQVHWQVDGNQIEICFDDSAPGVPAEALPHLFDRLYRVDASRNRATGGAGLGLAICHNIVSAHEGQIQAEASPLGGLRVRIRLPLTDH